LSAESVDTVLPPNYENVLHAEVFERSPKYNELLPALKRKQLELHFSLPAPNSMCFGD
jgi:hypothetical protein